MIALKSINKKSLIEYEGQLFMLVEKKEDIEIDQLYYVDAVIINSIESSVFEQILDGIRKHYNPVVYLKPVFAVHNRDISKRYIQCCDDTTDLVQYQHIAKRSQSINQRIEKLFQLQRFPSVEMEYLYKTLQFLYTREEPMTPIPYRNAKIGYHFPLLSRMINDENGETILRVVETGDHKGYLSTEYIDKTHLCECGSSHHNIRETCGNCGSIDLRSEDLIHHFQCAYVGPESDFKSDDEYDDRLACPKCDKVARHIGIDYDKPSQIYHCNSCNQHFQEPKFSYHCLDCGVKKELSHLHEHPISRLSITSKGTQLVLKGLPTANAGIQRTVTETKLVGVYEFGVFQSLIKQEEARVKRSGKTSILGMIQLPGDQINRLSSHEVVNLQVELCTVLKGYLDDADSITSRSPSEYFILMTDISAQKAKEVKKMIEYNFKELVNGNFTDLNVEVTVEMQVLGAESAAVVSDDSVTD